MSYKIVRKEKPLVVYDLYIRYSGERYRKRVKCLSSVIVKVHNDWISRVFNGELDTKPIKGAMLKASFEAYLEWSKKHHSHGHFMRGCNAWKKIQLFLKQKNMRLESFTRAAALSFLDFYRASGKKKELDVATVNKCAMIFHSFFEWSRERELVPLNFGNPFRKTMQPTLGRDKMLLLTPEQIGELLSSCNYSHQRTFLLLALTTGMRHGELLSLEWKDVYLDKKMLILDAVKTKSRKSRVIPLIDIVVKYLSKISRECRYVVSFAGKRLVTFRKSWANIKKRLSWDASELRIHDLRHNCATFLKVAGVPMYLIARLLGHASQRMTERYSVINDEAFVSEMEKLGGLLSSKLSDICPTEILER